MRMSIALSGLVAFASSGLAQDTGWLVEQAPLVSMVVVKALDKCPSFTARVEVSVSGKADSVPSSASGTVECQNGNIRWEARLGDIKSTQLTESARVVVRQINGEQFLLLTRPDQRVNYLVLSGSQACLEQSLPTLKLSADKGPASAETVDGRVCLREKLTAVPSAGSPAQVLVWKSKELKGIPLQLQLTDAGETIQVRFKDIHFRTIPADRFRLPQGLTTYNSVEDLVQSVLISKVRRRMGLE